MRSLVTNSRAGGVIWRHKTESLWSQTSFWVPTMASSTKALRPCTVRAVPLIHPTWISLDFFIPAEEGLTLLPAWAANLKSYQKLLIKDNGTLALDKQDLCLLILSCKSKYHSPFKQKQKEHQEPSVSAGMLLSLWRWGSLNSPSVHHQMVKQLRTSNYSLVWSILQNLGKNLMRQTLTLWDLFFERFTWCLKADWALIGDVWVWGGNSDKGKITQGSGSSARSRSPSPWGDSKVWSGQSMCGTMPQGAAAALQEQD